MAQSLIQGVLGLLSDFLAPLVAAAANDQSRQTLFDTLGHTSSVSSNPAVLDVLRGAAALNASLSSLDESQLDSWDAVQKVLALTRQADALVDGLRQLANEP